jgi:hypothetical protein
MGAVAVEAERAAPAPAHGDNRSAGLPNQTVLGHHEGGSPHQHRPAAVRLGPDIRAADGDTAVDTRDRQRYDVVRLDRSLHDPDLPAHRPRQTTDGVPPDEGAAAQKEETDR